MLLLLLGAATTAAAGVYAYKHYLTAAQVAAVKAEIAKIEAEVVSLEPAVKTAVSVLIARIKAKL